MGKWLNEHHRQVGYFKKNAMRRTHALELVAYWAAPGGGFKKTSNEWAPLVRTILLNTSSKREGSVFSALTSVDPLVKTRAHGLYKDAIAKITNAKPPKVSAGIKEEVLEYALMRAKKLDVMGAKFYRKFKPNSGTQKVFEMLMLFPKAIQRVKRNVKRAGLGIGIAGILFLALILTKDRK